MCSIFNLFNNFEHDSQNSNDSHDSHDSQTRMTSRLADSQNSRPPPTAGISLGPHWRGETNVYMSPVYMTLN